MARKELLIFFYVMCFDSAKNVMLLDAHVWGRKDHFFQKASSGYLIIHP
jgi:hypothetical protein